MKKLNEEVNEEVEERSWLRNSKKWLWNLNNTSISKSLSTMIPFFIARNTKRKIRGIRGLLALLKQWLTFVFINFNKTFGSTCTNLSTSALHSSFIFFLTNELLLYPAPFVPQGYIKLVRMYAIPRRSLLYRWIHNPFLIVCPFLRYFDETLVQRRDLHFFGWILFKARLQGKWSKKHFH